MAPSTCGRCRRPISAAAAGAPASCSFEVYNLRDLGQFPGTYGQARYGFAIGTASAGDLWMQNESGVIMHLKAKRAGLMLSLGGDAVVISMRQ